MKSLFSVLPILLALGVSSSASAWPQWMKVGALVKLPAHELTRGLVSTNAILIQDFNPYGSTGLAVSGHVDADGKFTSFDHDIELSDSKLGELSTIRFQMSGNFLAVSENLQVLAAPRRDRKNIQAIGAARVLTSKSQFFLGPPADLSLRASRVNSGPLGQVNVAGRFFKLATPFQIGGEHFNVLKFGDYTTYDQGPVTFGTLGIEGEFIASRIKDETWRRRDGRTYLGGLDTPIFQMWDNESEIFHQLIGGRSDQKVVQRSALSVLVIAKRIDHFTTETATGEETPLSIIQALTRQTRALDTQPQPARTPRQRPNIVNATMCETLFEPAN